YSALSIPNRTVSSAGPPSRSSSSVTVIFCAVPASLIAIGLSATTTTQRGAGPRQPVNGRTTGTGHHRHPAAGSKEPNQEPTATAARPHRATASHHRCRQLPRLATASTLRPRRGHALV